MLASQNPSMQYTVITNIIDKHLQKWIDLELNSTPGHVPEEMLLTKAELDEDWQYWLPVKSSATDEEIAIFEKQIGYLLPESFKAFIKYKHFYELYIEEARFEKYLPNNWQEGLLEMIFKYYDPKLLIGKGYIAFALYGDWGMLCFDTSEPAIDNEYSIALWDHDDGKVYPLQYPNFTEMLITLDKKDDASRIQT